MAAFTRPLPCPMFLIPPSIDPLSDKNCPISETERLETLNRLGIDPDRPFLLQVSRFDRFKDPLGVIEAYRMVKPYHPEMQLVLAGGPADDDPEGAEVLREVMEAAGEDKDLKVLMLPPDSHRMINALQRSAIDRAAKVAQGRLRADRDRGALERQAGDRRRLRRNHAASPRLSHRLSWCTRRPGRPTASATCSAIPTSANGWGERASSSCASTFFSSDTCETTCPRCSVSTHRARWIWSPDSRRQDGQARPENGEGPQPRSQRSRRKMSGHDR